MVLVTIGRMKLLLSWYVQQRQTGNAGIGTKRIRTFPTGLLGPGMLWRDILSYKSEFSFRSGTGWMVRKINKNKINVAENEKNNLGGSSSGFWEILLLEGARLPV